MFIGVWGLVACTETGASQPAGDRVPPAAVTIPAIAPTDFVIVPCGALEHLSECVIVAAGGKRILVGAPAGIGEGKISGDAIPLDGVILLSLHAEAVEGLDEVRNRAWVSGRRAPLSIAGPDGTDQLVRALNQAYVTSDALAYIEGKRDGGFDQDAIIANVIAPGEVAFDTGDLTISAVQGGGAKLALLIDYEGQKVLLAACGAQERDAVTWPKVDIYIGCKQAGYDGPIFAAWPLNGLVDLTR